MVFKRNTLRNTRTFKQSTSINTSNINTNNISNKPPVKTTIQPTSVSQGRQNYNTGYTSDWRLKDLFKTNPPAYAEEIPDISEVTGTPEPTSTPIEKRFGMDKYDGHNAGFEKIETVNNNSEYDWQLGALHSKDGILGFSFGTPTIHTPNEAAGELDKQGSVPTPDITADFHAEGLPIDEMPRSDLQGQGSFNNPITDKTTFATAKEGHELFDIPDYVNNEVRSSYYGLGMNITPEVHTNTINKQQLRKFENSLQKDWSTLVRSNAVDDVTYLNLQMRIGEANISAAEKKRLIGVFQKKKNKLQGTSVSSPRNPNKAEQLKSKIDSGNFTGKDWDQYQTLTGNPVLYSGNKSKVTRADGTFKPKVLTYKDLF